MTNYEEKMNNSIKIENNAVLWLRQMVLTLSVSAAILVYFEKYNIYNNSLIARLSLYLLIVTAFIIGIINTLTFKKRHEALLKNNLINDTFSSNWYFYMCILTIIGFLGVFYSIINFKLFSK